MAKYKLWNGKDPVYTLGAPYKFTPDEWRAEYPWTEVDDCVISGEGVINGAFCMPYTDMIAIYAKQGCDFSDCKTKQEHLDAIEQFEIVMNEPSTELTPEERIAAAVELQAMASLPDVEV